MEKTSGRPDNVPDDRVFDIDIYMPSPDKGDYHEAWSKVHAFTDLQLIWTPKNDGHWIAVRTDAINAVLSDYEHFSNRVIFVPRSSGEAHNIIPTTLDPPEHRPYRTILNSSLAPKSVNQVEPKFRAIAGELMDAFQDRGWCNFTTEFAEHFPIRIFMEIIDLPVADAPRLKRLADQTIRPDGTMTYEQALQGMYDYLNPHLEARRGGSGGDMLSRIVNGEVNGRPVSMQEAREMGAQMLIAGLDTVVNFLGFIMAFLAVNDGERRWLAEDPKNIPGFINELLRRFGIVTTGRIVREDYMFDGVQLREGDMVMVPTGLHGIDPAVYEDPLNVRRGRTGIRHSAFGVGNHVCPGAHLARAEVLATLEEWLSRIPEFRIKRGSALQYTGGIVAHIEEVLLEWD
jgi:cytochrome P450